MIARNILGVHDGHNSSVALLQNGRITYAVQEERLSRVKNQGGVPARATADVLEAADLRRADCGRIPLNGLHTSYEHLERETLLEHYEGSSGWRDRIKQPLKQTVIYDVYRKTKVVERERRLVAAGFDRAALVPVEHHTCHAATAYYGCGWQGKVLVLTCDGSGDNLSATVSIGEQGRLQRIATVPANDSIGRVYSMVTFMLGMMPLEHEYKVMGLAPYVGNGGKAPAAARMFHDLFEFDAARPMTWRRRRGVPSMYSSHQFFRRLLYRRRFDLVAAGVQQFVEDMLTTWVRQCVRETGIPRIACAGGVFMNVKANKAILELPEVQEMFVFPSCGDETNSIGAAYWVQAQERLAAGLAPGIEPLGSIYWGREHTDDQIEEALRSFRGRHRLRYDFVKDVEERTARSLAAGEIVARVKGRMEFGARSLGNRAILARADNMNAIRVINDMIKNRDFWMPFAPSVLAERADDYYAKPKPMAAPYMIMAFDSKPATRDRYPAGQHPYDHTARPQEVTAESNPDYYRLLKHYEEVTGEGIILNTSLNLHGHPLVYTPAGALEVLDQSGLDTVALGNWWVTKQA